MQHGRKWMTQMEQLGKRHPYCPGDHDVGHIGPRVAGVSVHEGQLERAPASDHGVSYIRHGTADQLDDVGPHVRCAVLLAAGFSDGHRAADEQLYLPVPRGWREIE